MTDEELIRRLVAERDQLQLLVEHIPSVLYIDEVPEPGVALYRTRYVGPQVEQVLGITADRWMGDDSLWEQVMHPEDWERARNEYERYIERGGTLVQEYRLIRPSDGRVVWVRDECAMVNDPESDQMIVLGVMVDVTEQKHLENQLRAAEAKNRALIEQIPNIIWIEPLEGAHEPPYVSASVEQLFGATPSEWLHTDWWIEHVHADDRPKVTELRRRMLEGSSEPERVEYRIHATDGRELWISQIVQVVFDGDTPWMLQSLLEDITLRKSAEQELEFRATHDALTGLANRSMFVESVEVALARARRYGTAVALLFCDVDGFKAANDTYGHEAGDEILKAIASRLASSVRESDVVGRLGGDEFLVLLPDLERGPGALPGAADGRGSPGLGPADELPARVAAEISERITESLAEPITFAGGRISVSISIGQCLFPGEASTTAELLARADAAMYAAKAGANPA